MKNDGEIPHENEAFLNLRSVIKMPWGEIVIFGPTVNPVKRLSTAN